MGLSRIKNCAVLAVIMTVFMAYKKDGYIDIRKESQNFVSTDRVIESFIGLESAIKTVTTYLLCECSKHIYQVKFHPFQSSAEIDTIQ